MQRTRCSGLATLAGSILLICVPVLANADSGYVAPREELPLTAPLVTGARALGMGGVSMAVSDDASALTANPAGLSRLNRIELSAGFRRNSLSWTGEMRGSAFESDLTGTDFTSLRFAYPFPTFRGSLVFALGAERVYDFREDHLAAYDDLIEWEEVTGQGDVSGVWENREDFLSDGGATALSVAAAVDVSPKISLGGALTYVTGDYSRTFRYDVYDVYDVSERYTDAHILEQYSADVSGLKATVGGLFYVAEGISVGVAVESPLKLTFDGSENGYIERVAVNPDSGSYDAYSILFSDEITLPFSIRAGVAYSPTDLVVLAADVGYTDWSQIDYAGEIAVVEVVDDLYERRSVYDEAFSFALGAEVTLPSWPIRLRGGYSSRPLSYGGLETETDRSYFTIGAGVLIDTVLAVDVAWVKGAFERSAPSYEFREETEDSSLVLEATYRS